MKKTAIAASLLTALLSIHSGAFASCTGTGCASDISAEVNLNTDYNLDPNHNGIYIQVNRGNNSSNLQLNNVIVNNNGSLTANSTSVGNNIDVQVSLGSTVPVRHVSQSNFGDATALVTLYQSGSSRPGEVSLNATAVGNNFSFNGNGVSLAELSVAQCNVGNNLASVNFKNDPSSLSATATAVGNSISVRSVK
ncbi:hypothetical protein NQT62_01505 [Limnobacter humi]|uniref:Auto-transporter adhesin head GIN domain-containing protein n=1 Tax=Limnobacter humi TaxID=1778671 RepID=A0ABT1WC73_9BURK|nr:hypothetical protein [Limnobacter humi]MCQ8895112.1 hypothetical protein [Limnobacter humi]